MDNQLLKQFHDQKHMREEVLKYYKSVLDEIVLEKVHNSKDTTNLNEAYTALDKAHKKLINEFGTKQRVETKPRNI